MSIKIPTESKKHTVSSGSDLNGTINYTKNINLDEQGYIKLSPRTAQIYSEKTDGNMELPIAFGRTSSASATSFHMVSSEDPFDITIGETAITVTEDTTSNNPNYTLDSHGKWFHNKWISTDDNGIYILDGSTWDAGDTSSLTSGVAHPIEVFRNKDRICFGDGNTVKMYSESGGTLTLDKTLTLPSGFEVIGLAYSNYKMGIITQLSDTAQGQNQDAYFFTWDGATAEAGQGVDIGSDRTLGVIPYKGSHLITTRTGQIRYFTGGGWQDLASLPPFSKSLLIGTSWQRDFYGDNMLVDGDSVYINNNGLVANFGDKYQQYIPENPGGILCYDPNVSLYHRFSHSISPLSMLTVTSANVDTTTDIMTVTAGTIPSTGSEIKYTSDKTNQIGGLKTRQIYYCIKHNSTQFSLAETPDDATNGVKIDLTSTGASNNYFLGLETYDYGVTLADNIGGMSTMDTNNGISDHLIFGSQLYDFNSTSKYYSLQIVADDFSNRGYFVTPKITSTVVQDMTPKLYIKYRTLGDNDSIIVKTKKEDIIGLPVSTPQRRTSGFNQCSWTSSTTFTTTADLSDAKTAFDAEKELECEIISGAGAGNLVKISSLNYSTGTYTVQLEESVVGASSGRYCDVVIDNWEVIAEIDSTDGKNFREINVERPSSWTKFKVELRGNGTTIEELYLITTPNK